MTPDDGIIQLDHLSTTLPDPWVVEAMRPHLGDAHANPHADHRPGWRAAAAVGCAADQVAALIGADPAEIVFTSGATEANNTALKGVAWSGDRRGDHLVVSAIEHRCMLEAARWLAGRGCEVTVVPPDARGFVSPDVVARAIRDDTALVSVQLANNEVGTVQPVAAIAEICRARGVPVHTDAAQAVGKLPVDVHALGVDLMSLSAHKMHGPAGIGALFVSADGPVRLEPLLHGGGQQDGRRAGTVPTALCVGFGEAARLAGERMEADAHRVAALRARLLLGLQSRVPDAIEHGAEPRLPGCLSLRVPGADAADVLMRLQGRLAASAGSACRSGSTEPSHVLLAMGLTGEQAAQTIRLGIGRGTTEGEMDRAAEMLGDAMEAARRLAA